MIKPDYMDIKNVESLVNKEFFELAADERDWIKPYWVSPFLVELSNVTDIGDSFQLEKSRHKVWKLTNMIEKGDDVYDVVFDPCKGNFRICICMADSNIYDMMVCEDSIRKILLRI